MRENILLSIIITNFNKAEYLNECINSITRQNLEKVEVILIDDNSRDKSRKILKKYEKKIKIVYNKKNKGPSACRNIGIKLSSGIYVSFVDADDKIYASLSKIKKNIIYKKNKSDLILLKYSSTNSSLNNYGYFSKKKLFQGFLTDLFLKKKLFFLKQEESVWYIFFRKDFLKKKKILFLEKSNCLEDLDFFVRSILLSKYIGLLNIKYYFYRELEQSLKKKFSIDRTLGAFNVYKSIKSFQKKKLTPVKINFLNMRLKFVKNIFLLRYYLLNNKKNFIRNKKFQNIVCEFKKKIVKNFKIKKNDKIAIYCYGPSGKFLYKLLKELGLNKILFIDDNKRLINKNIKKDKICSLDQIINKNFKVIIANPKKRVVLNIRKKNKEIKMLHFDINKFSINLGKNSFF